MCGQLTPEIAVKMAQIAPFLQSLTIKGVYTADSLLIPIICTCARLERLDFICRCEWVTDNTRCFEITHLSIVKIAERYPDILELNLSHVLNVNDIALTTLSDRCHNLKILQLVQCEGVSDASLV